MIHLDLLEGGPILVDEIRTMIDRARPERPRVDPSRVIGIGELAAVLGVSTMTIRRWSDAGRIPEPERAPGQPPGWRRWPIAVAIQIVKDAGARVPEKGMKSTSFAAWSWGSSVAAPPAANGVARPFLVPSPLTVGRALPTVPGKERK